MQRHEYYIDVNGTIAEVWDVFWDRTRPRSDSRDNDEMIALTEGAVRWNRGEG